MIVSSCCGAEMSILMTDIGICPECKEHCDHEIYSDETESE